MRSIERDVHGLHVARRQRVRRRNAPRAEIVEAVAQQFLAAMAKDAKP
jgi:hypothetical protein